eukprot:350018-Chlamydomonas_euryale.AAC.2
MAIAVTATSTLHTDTLPAPRAARPAARARSIVTVIVIDDIATPASVRISKQLHGIVFARAAATILAAPLHARASACRVPNVAPRDVAVDGSQRGRVGMMGIKSCLCVHGNRCCLCVHSP